MLKKCENEEETIQFKNFNKFLFSKYLYINYETLLVQNINILKKLDEQKELWKLGLSNRHILMSDTSTIGDGIYNFSKLNYIYSSIGIQVW